jgi:small-conductance mechanosensitive channel
MPARLLLTLLLSLLMLPGAAAQSSSSGPHVYKVESLNPGLPSPPPMLNRETPQASMEAFYTAAAKEDWEQAAHLLELTFLPEDVQAETGPELAEQLHLVLERGLLIDWAGLSDRPDGVDTTSSSDAPLAGQPRRNFALTLVKLPGRPVTIRIARLATEDGEPVWVFPRQTVENIPALYAHFRPKGVEALMPPFMLETAFWTLTWWEVVALPILLALSFGLASLVYWLIGRLAKKADGVSVLAVVLDAVRWPSALLVFAGSFFLLRRSFFTLSGAVNAVIAPIVTAAVVLAICALFVRVLDAVIERLTGSEGVDITQPDAEADRSYYTTLSAIRRFVLVLLLIIGTAFVLIQSNIDRTLGFSLLMSAGAIGIVLAFAARAALDNIMASLQIGLAKTARMGDAVFFDNELAYVEKIGFTHVRLRTWDGRRLIAPVRQFVGETFENWTQTDPSMSKYVLLTLDHRADIDAMRKAFDDFVQSEDDIIDKDDAGVQVTGHSREGMEVRFLFRAPDAGTAWNIHCRLREAMLREASRLDDTGEGKRIFLPREREVKADTEAA